MSGIVMRGVELANVDISGEISGLFPLALKVWPVVVRAGVLRDPSSWGGAGLVPVVRSAAGPRSGVAGVIIAAVVAAAGCRPAVGLDRGGRGSAAGAKIWVITAAGGFVVWRWLADEAAEVDVSSLRDLASLLAAFRAPGTFQSDEK